MGEALRDDTMHGVCMCSETVPKGGILCNMSFEIVGSDEDNC